MMRAIYRCVMLAAVYGAAVQTAAAQGQVVKAKVRTGPPEWTKGIVPISKETYDSAIACGKQGGQSPACVFWDTDACKNKEFELTFSTPYKTVAQAVWNAVRQNQPAPAPDFAEAQRASVTIAVKALKPKDNPVVDMYITRDRVIVKPTTRASLTGGDGQFTFDYPVWAPTTEIDLEVVGKNRPALCKVEKSELARMR